MWSIDVDETSQEHYIPGDLVVFTGHLYSPDYVYAEHYNPTARTIGIVVGTSGGPIADILYRVYWLKARRITEVVSGHIKLLYAQNKTPSSR